MLVISRPRPRQEIPVEVYLKTNDPDEPEVVVSLFGIVNGIAGVYPGHFNLGEIGQEESIRSDSYQQ